MLHGVENYVFKKEGAITAPLLPERAHKRSYRKGTRNEAHDPFETTLERMMAPKQLFCRLFDKGPQPDADALIALGLEMETELDGDAKPDSSIAAGFTYLGQFIDHDITFDTTPLMAAGTADPMFAEGRTPALDLDSVYRGGPDISPELYDSDGASFIIGTCSPSPDQDGNQIGAIPNDLPRESKVAVIGDPRNDENLAIAQLHLAFLKFHNAIVAERRSEMPSLPSHVLFRKARQEVIEFYQKIVIRDFLSKIIDYNAIENVLKNGFKIFDKKDHDCMPIEFSVAAFRYGHSMIRPAYEWNRVFNSKPGALAPGSLELLFEFTEFSGSTTPGDSGFFGGDTLPSNWAVDWRLMFDIEGHPPDPGFETNRARQIDTQLAFPLKNLPEFLGGGETDPAFVSLAARNLLRGRMVELPHGLAVAQAIKDRAGLAFDALSADELRGGPHGAKLDEVGLVETPPLWYYILREAEMENGESLGPVGSRIVAETILAHIRNSDVSILRGMGNGGVFDVERKTMSDMLKIVNDLTPV